MIMKDESEMHIWRVILIDLKVYFALFRIIMMASDVPNLGESDNHLMIL